MTQDAKILAHMETGDSITPAQAYEIAGTLALHSAISRIRDKGYAVQKIMRHENGKHFGEYFIGIAHG
jgi:hypothetical protein